MSYPFGSGMPQPNNNSSSYPNTFPYPHQAPGTGYPHQNIGAGYPHQQNISAPYPAQSSNQQHGFAPQPGYPPHSGFTGGPPMHNNPNPIHTQGAGYPTQLVYPQSSQTSCQPQPYMHSNTMFPTPISSSTPYPQSNRSMPSTNVHQHRLGHTPPHGGVSAGGSATSNLANCFQEMQSHIGQIQIENKSKGNPTVIPATNFDPVADAKALRKAMKGFGTDEDGLIDVICRRSNEQRIMIQRSFKTNFGKDLIEDVKSETSGNFENLLVALLTPLVDFYVKELHNAMAGIGTDEDVLIEILCSMSNFEIHTIKNAYERLYGKNLESEIMSETSGNFKRLLVSLCTGGRDESGYTDIDAARRDATELLRAGELRVGTDESTFNMILCQRNYAQIKLICEEYAKMTGHSLVDAIQSEFSGDILDGLTAIIQCTSNKAEFFATRLQKSMAGIGTNDTQLIRIIVTRSEIDLNDIKAAFERLYGKSLRSWIKGDTSGHYKHALYALIGEQRSS